MPLMGTRFDILKDILSHSEAFSVNCAVHSIVFVAFKRKKVFEDEIYLHLIFHLLYV